MWHVDSNCCLKHSGVVWRDYFQYPVSDLYSDQRYVVWRWRRVELWCLSKCRTRILLVHANGTCYESREKSRVLCPETLMCIDSYRDTTPFASHTSETFTRPACFSTDGTFRVRREITFAPMMMLPNWCRWLENDEFCRVSSSTLTWSLTGT